MKTSRMKLFAALAIVLLGASLMCYATATPIAAQTPVGPYPASVGAAALDLTETAADTGNGNSFLITGHEVLIIHNTDSSAHTITLTTVADQFGRTNDVTSYSVGANKVSAFNFINGVAGWQQTDGTMHLSANSALIKFAILTVNPR